VSSIRADAKLTLSLRVIGVRDDGYHFLDAEMVTLDLADTLTFTEGDGLDVVDATDGGLAIAAGNDNLVRRALDAIGRRTHVQLTKRIPAGAGLGGGSADAAAVLRWAEIDDPTVAVGLGADVLFCVRGGRARVTGIGDIVEPQPFQPASYTLALPPFGCETAAVYRMWDDMGGPTGEHGNDLEPAALRVEPRLVEWRDRLRDATGSEPTLAGSGSTWFVEGEFPGPNRVVTHTTPAFVG
jgi:4-diphosphocytidyl-2-C-methyl-D-erythritol kinase